MKRSRTKDKTGRESQAQVRKRAEKALGKLVGNVEAETLSADEVRRLVHELQVHQIELEMQNEELRLTQQMLEESQSKYADLYDFAPVGYFTLERHGVILETNLTGAALLGEPRSGLIGKPFRLYVHRDSQDTFFLHPRKVLKSKERQTCEVKLKRKDGSEIIASLESSPTMENTIHTIVNDITGRKQAELSLQRIREDLSRAQEVGSIGSWRLDVQKNVLTWSDEIHRIFGVPKGTTMSYETFLSSVHPDDREYVDTQWKAALRGEDYDIEHRIVTDGETKWIREKAYLEFNKEGDLLGGFGIAQDISDMKRTEEELAESERKYRGLFENMLNGFAYHLMIVDEKGNPVDYLFLEVNNAFERMTGLKRKDVVGKTVTEVIPSIRDDIFDWIGEYGKVALEGKELKTEQFSEPLDRWYAASAYSPKKGYFAVVFEDINEKKKADMELRESEERFRSTFQNAAVGVAHRGLDGRWLSVNEKLCDIVGYSEKELLHMTFQDIVHPDDLEAELKQARRLMEGLIDSFSIEKRYVRKDGSVVWVNLTGSLQRDEEGNPLYFIAVVEDIGARKQIEEDLRESKNAISEVLASISDAFVSFDMGWRCTYVNDQAEKMFRKTREQMIGRKLQELFPETVDGEFYRQFRRSVTEKRVVRFEVWYGPLEMWFSCSCYPSAHGLSVYFLDVTDRKKAEEELKDKRKLIEDISNTVPEIIYIFDLEDHRLDYANPSLKRELGYEVDEISLLGENVLGDLVHPDDVPVLQKTMKELFKAAGGKIVKSEFRVRNADQRWLWIESRMIVFSRTGGGRAKKVLGAAHDISERKDIEETLREYRHNLEEMVNERTSELRDVNAELETEISNRRLAEEEIKFNYEALRLSNQLLEQVFSNVHLCIAYLDNDFNFIRVNRAYAQSNGNEPVFFVGKNHFDLYPNEENERIFRTVVDTGEPYSVIEKAFGFPGHPEFGTSYWDWSLNPIKGRRGRVEGLVLSLLDVTEKKRAEIDAMRAAHLASLGELAAGVAHEINNPINGIINYAQILLDDPGDNKLVVDLSGKLIKEGTRIEQIVRSLLSFARQEEREHEPADVSSILDEGMVLTDVQLRKRNIRVERRFPSDLPNVVVNRQQIQQVFLNLISNAWHALDQKYPDSHPDKIIEITGSQKLYGGRQVVEVIFYDRGSGIPASRLNSVMNPFFTTKPTGEGTGLGLSISHNIVKDHGGAISIESVEGEFTRVTVTLLAEEKAEISEG